MKEVYIVSAKRTAVGSFLGSFKNISASKMTAKLIQNFLLENKLDSKIISEVIIGQVLTAGQGQNPARQAALGAQIDISVPCTNINQVCGSGLKSVAFAHDSIISGGNELVIAGGQENMSASLHGAALRAGKKMGDMNLIDLMQFDGLTDAYSGVLMGVTAENIAKKFDISREDQDLYSLTSQQKASFACKNGLFTNEIVPIEVKQGREMKTIDKDEFIKHNLTIADLQKLKPAFQKDGTVTAGNSSGLNDGSAIIALASAAALKKYNLNPIARIVSHASAGVDPQLMGLGPTEAVPKALKRAGWNINDLNIIESNEAFAAQAMGVAKHLNFDPKIVNLNGGAIAIGHPIGASGSRVLVSLVNQMQRLKHKKGLATLCIGGGMGIAMCVENI